MESDKQNKFKTLKNFLQQDSKRTEHLSFDQILKDHQSNRQNNLFNHEKAKPSNLILLSKNILFHKYGKAISFNPEKKEFNKILKSTRCALTIKATDIKFYSCKNLITQNHQKIISIEKFKSLWNFYQFVILIPTLKDWSVFTSTFGYFHYYKSRREIIIKEVLLTLTESTIEHMNLDYIEKLEAKRSRFSRRKKTTAENIQQKRPRLESLDLLKDLVDPTFGMKESMIDRKIDVEHGNDLTIMNVFEKMLSPKAIEKRTLFIKEKNKKEFIKSKLCGLHSKKKGKVFSSLRFEKQLFIKKNEFCSKIDFGVGRLSHSKPTPIKKIENMTSEKNDKIRSYLFLKPQSFESTKPNALISKKTSYLTKDEKMKELISEKPIECINFLSFLNIYSAKKNNNKKVLNVNRKMTQNLMRDSRKSSGKSKNVIQRCFQFKSEKVISIISKPKIKMFEDLDRMKCVYKDFKKISHENNVLFETNTKNKTRLSNTSRNFSKINIVSNKINVNSFEPKLVMSKKVTNNQKERGFDRASLFRGFHKERLSMMDAKKAKEDSYKTIMTMEYSQRTSRNQKSALHKNSFHARCERLCQASDVLEEYFDNKKKDDKFFDMKTMFKKKQLCLQVDSMRPKTLIQNEEQNKKTLENNRVIHLSEEKQRYYSQQEILKRDDQIQTCEIVSIKGCIGNIHHKLPDRKKELEIESIFQKNKKSSFKGE